MTNSIPLDSITAGGYSAVMGTTTIVAGNDDKTIVTIGIASSGGSGFIDLYCGNNRISRQFDNSLGVTPVNIFCDEPITMYNTTNLTDGSVIINYVPYNIADVATSESFNPPNNITASSSISVYGYMSAGEMMISALLFGIIFIKIAELIARGLNKIDTKKTFIAYQNSDVEIENRH